jgi:hypothetical protein
MKNSIKVIEEMTEAIKQRFIKDKQTKIDHPCWPMVSHTIVMGPEGVWCCGWCGKPDPTPEHIRSHIDEGER